MLVFTDGVTTQGDTAQTERRARDLRAGAGVEVFTVSLDTQETDSEELNNLATSFQHIIQVSGRPEVHTELSHFRWMYVTVRREGGHPVGGGQPSRWRRARPPQISIGDRILWLV